MAAERNFAALCRDHGENRPSLSIALVIEVPGGTRPVGALRVVHGDGRERDAFNVTGAESPAIKLEISLPAMGSIGCFRLTVAGPEFSIHRWNQS